MTQTTANSAPLDPVDVAIGARIRSRREKLRITQAQLAAGAAVTFQQVQKYERGINRVSAARLLQIAAVLGTTGSDLLGELDDAQEVEVLLSQPQVARLLKAFCSLPEDQCAAVLTLVEGMVR